MAWTDYNRHQRWAFMAVGVALTLCIAAVLSPHWMSAKMLADETFLYQTRNSSLNPDGATTNFRSVGVNLGLWWYCLVDQAEHHEIKCLTFAPEGFLKGHNGKSLKQDDSPEYVLFVQTLMCSCLALAGVGLLMVCFYYCTCCSNGKTLGYGVLFFIAGLLGFAAVFIFTFKVDVLLSIPVHSDMRFGWSFPVFVIGCCIMTIASVVLVFPPSKHMDMSYHTVLMANQHEVAGQLGAFEPLPLPLSYKTKNDL